jgi:hypothetical protein
VAEHRRPGDVVLVNSSSNWGFGYYWTADQPERQSDSSNLQGYIVTYRRSSGIVVATDRTAKAIGTALDSALALARERHGRIWVVRTHVQPSEESAWQQDYAERNESPQAQLYPPAGTGGSLVASVQLLTP